MANEETLICGNSTKGQSRGKTILKKDIYVIRNTINDKCYVGQSVNYKTRFRKHKEEARRNNYKYKSVLYNAMNALGIDNFYVELLESQVENYNEREIYWINKLNTIRPNGYNLAKGGNWYPNLSGTLHHNATIKSESILNDIYDKLLNSDLSLKEIAELYKIHYGIIGEINKGHNYIKEGYTYPLRKMTLSKDDVNRLTFDLKYSNYTYEELAKMYGITFGQVKCINYGKSWHRDYIKYPIREAGYSAQREDGLVEKIQKDLISTELSFEEISKKYNCKKNVVMRINNGSSFKNENLQYPLRRLKKPWSREKINEVCDLLANTDYSINEISNITKVPQTTIRYINSGKSKRYKGLNYIYPIRSKNK